MQIKRKNKITISELALMVKRGFDDVDKKFDLWVHGTVGFFTPISEGIFFDVQGKFGYNLTNSQFDKVETNFMGDLEPEPASAWDMAVYVGIGFQPTRSGI